MTADLKRFTFLISFRNGETRSGTYTDTDAKSARELCWKLLPAKDQERSPTIKLLTNSEAA
jgi:hypothetical protein